MVGPGAGRAPDRRAPQGGPGDFRGGTCRATDIADALMLPAAAVPTTLLPWGRTLLLLWYSLPPKRARSDKFYKGRSQEKTHLLRLEFSLLLSPLDRARSVLTYRAMCSVAGQYDPVVWVFSTSGLRFSSSNPRPNQRPPKDHRSLQLCVLYLRFFQDGDVRVGVFPKREEILVGSAGNKGSMAKDKR
jgi:hypothetical protein